MDLIFIRKEVVLGYGVKLEVWGDYALFTRPELKVERYSYDVITPSAAKGLFRSIYWHPGIEWVIDRVVVINPIKFTNIRRNEVKHKISASSAFKNLKDNKQMSLYTGESIVQRASTVLQDVRYVIEAHFNLTEKVGKEDTPEKIYNIVLRRIRKGQCFSQPFLGCREFIANFCEPKSNYAGFEKNTRNLGLMLFDLDYSNPHEIKPMFFNAILKDGILDLRNCEVLR